MFFLLQTFAYAQSAAGLPRLEPDPKALEYYNLRSQNGAYSWIELAEISLWASGDTSATNLEKIRQLAAALNNSADLPAGGKERAKYILEFLYRNTLRSYSIYQTRVDSIFSAGRYNCVSSSVLYMILCESAGVKTSGVITRDHAFVIVHIDGENIDVETTNRYGFEPGTRTEFHDQFGRATGFAYVPANNYRDRQTISQIELVSLILNNRISEHERENRFALSVPIAIDRAALLCGSSLGVNYDYKDGVLFDNPYSEIIDRLFNYGSMLLRSNREEEGLRWASAVSPKFPDAPRWQDYFLTAVNNRITRYIRANNITDARNFLESNKTLISNENYAQFDTALIDTDIIRRINLIRSAADGNAVISTIEQAGRKISERRTAELKTFAIQKTAAVLCEAPGRDWRAAIQYLENAVRRYGANSELEQMINTYKGNLVADYHNRFATQWNRRNFDEAQKILEDGLKEFPNDRQLLSDMEIVSKNRQ